MASESGVVGGRVDGGGRQRLEAALVQPAPLTTEQLLGDRVGHQRMHEPEAVVGDLHHETTSHQRAQRRQQRLVAERGDDQQRVERRRIVEHGERVEDAPLVGFEPGQLLVDGVAQRPRQLDRGDLGGLLSGRATIEGSGTDQFLDHERDAVAAPDHCLDERRRGLLADDGVDQRADVLVVETVETDLLDGVGLLETPDQLAAGRPAAQRTRAVGGDEHERGPWLTGERIDDTRTGIVEPVDVLEDEHGGLPGQTRRESSHEEIRHRVAVGSRRLVVAREQPGEGVVRTVDRSRLGADHDDLEFVVERPHELLDQAGLPDAWLARHESDRRVVAGGHLGRLDEADETRQRPDPPDHDRAHADACGQHRGGSVERGTHEPYGTGVPNHAIRGLSGGWAGSRRSAPGPEPADHTTALRIGHQLTVAAVRHVEEEVCVHDSTVAT